MARQYGGNAHDRAKAKTSQEQGAPKRTPNVVDPSGSAKKDTVISGGNLKRCLSKGWVQTVILSTIFLVIALPATDFYNWFKAYIFGPITVTPSKITYGFVKPDALNAFSGGYPFKITNTADQDVYNVIVKLLVDTTAVSLKDFGLKVEQDGLKPMNSDTPDDQQVGDVLDMGCTDNSGRVYFLFLMPHMEAGGHRELTLTYRNAEYNQSSISPGTTTLTIPNLDDGFIVRSKVMQFNKTPTPTLSTAKEKMFLFGLKEGLSCATPSLTALPSNAINSHPPPSEEEVNDAKVLGVQLLNEYASKHCPLKPQEAIAWANRELQIRNKRFRISGMTLSKQACRGVPAINFQHARGLNIDGVTVVNASGPGIVVGHSPGSSVNNNTVVYGDHTQFTTRSPAAPSPH